MMPRLSPCPRALLVAAVLVLGLGLPAAGGETRPLLWEIRGQPSSWILGTIHLPDPRLHELPPAVDTAFAASEVFYGELEMNAAAMMAASARSLLPEGRTLRGELPPDVARRATEYVQRRGRDMALFDRFTVWAFIMQLTLLDMTERLLTTAPLDLELYRRAVETGMETGGLETLDEQLAAFEALTPAEEAELLAWTLDDLEAAESAEISPLDQLLDLYLAGDLQRLETEARGAIDASSPTGRKFERLLVTERNQRMAERIARMVRDRPGTGFFFAVGALHVAGDGGLPALLRRAGLDVIRSSGVSEPVAAAP